MTFENLWLSAVFCTCEYAQLLYIHTHGHTFSHISSEYKMGKIKKLSPVYVFFFLKTIFTDILCILDINLIVKIKWSHVGNIKAFTKKVLKTF